MSYNLRTLLEVVTVSSILLYLLLAAPGLVATVGLYLFTTLLVTFLATGAVYAGDTLKAFCRGALLLTLAYYLWLTWSFFQIILQGNVDSRSALIELGDQAASVLRRCTIASTIMSALMGLAALAFKRLVEPKAQRAPPPQP